MSKTNQNPHPNARKAAEGVLAAAREAGWARAKVELSPDGSVVCDVAMTFEADTADDFLNGNLRMGG